MSEFVKRFARLPQDRRSAFLAQLGADGAGSGAAAGRPAAAAQRMLWFLDRLAPGRPVYNVPCCLRLRGDVDVDALAGALAAVVARHEALRAALEEGGDGVALRLAEHLDVALAPVAAPGATVTERERAALEEARRLAVEPFALTDPPLWRARLLRIAPDDHLLVFVAHYAVFDGPSEDVLVRDLAALYRARRRGEPDRLPELPGGYRDYVAWEQAQLDEARRAELAAFWRERLAGLPTLELATDRPRPPELTVDGATLRLDLGADLAGRVERLAAAAGVTSWHVHLAAFASLLRRYTRQDDLPVGLLADLRARAGAHDHVGLFAGMLVLRPDLSGDPPFRTLLQGLAAHAGEALEHAALPFDEVVRAVQPRRDPSRSPLFQVAFSSRRLADLPELDGGVTLERVPLTGDSARLDLSWTVRESSHGASVAAEFNTRLFDHGTVEQMLRHFAGLLRAHVDDPDAPLSHPALLDGDEERELLTRWNGPERPVRHGTVHELFEERVAAAPDAVAVVVGDRETSYDELNRAANRLARVLRARGAGPDAPVAFSLARGLDAVVCMLAALKAGASYVPLDPAHPPARTARILAGARCAAVVTRGGAVTPEGGALVDLAAPGLQQELAAQPDGDPGWPVDARDVAYVLHTSGSTGTPKGVLIEHRAVVNFVDAVTELFELGPRDRVLAYASYTFDVSVFEAFAALLNGARLYVATDDDRLDIDRLQGLMEEAGITVIDMPPTVMALLEPERFERLRIAFVGGEAFPCALVNRWNPGRRFFNGYGPTECTVTMVVHECPGHWDSSPPIGLPIANHVAHVLDERLRPVPYGVPGELVIGGEGLARGYLGDPELTAEKFVDDPFGTVPGGRLYRTGDLVRRRRDGALVFLGRIDQQVKVRGVRIELGEVSSALASHHAVAQSVALPWEDPSGERHLVAYVTARDGTELDPRDLREHLTRHLPAAMVPAHLVVLDRLPLTPAGKIDGAALPDPAPEAGAGEDMGAPPRTETERVLAEEVFARVLGRPAGRDGDFFELGGSSLQAAQIIAAARRQFGVTISVADFFREPTVAALAALVDRRAAASMDDDELLDLLEAMPEDEAERLLGAGEQGGWDS